MQEFVLMGLFAEVEVRRNRVLEEMNDEIAEQDQESGISAAELKAGRHHLDQRGGEHEAGAQRDKVF